MLHGIASPLLRSSFVNSPWKYTHINLCARTFMKSSPSLPFRSFCTAWSSVSFACNTLFTVCSWPVCDQVSHFNCLAFEVEIWGFWLVCTAHPEVRWHGCPWFALPYPNTESDLYNIHTGILTLKQSVLVHKPFLCIHDIIITFQLHKTSHSTPVYLQLE